MNLVGVGQFESRREGPTLLAAETFQRTDRALDHERLGFGNVQLPPRDDLPEAEVAGLALKLLVFLVHFAAALRAARRKRREIAGDGVALMMLRLGDDMLGHAHDIAHELLPLQFAVLHLREPEHPFGGELG